MIDVFLNVMVSHCSAVSRGNLPYHCGLRGRWCSPSAQSLLERTLWPSPRACQYHSSVCISTSHSYCRMDTPASSPPQFRSLGHMQRKPTARYFCSRTRHCGYSWWHHHRNPDHSEQCRSRLEGHFCCWFPRWYFHIDCCLERHVRRKY